MNWKMKEQNEQPIDEIDDDPLADPAVTDEIARLNAERDEFRDKWMRALADAENSRKRADKDRRDAEQYGGSRLARDLLPVHDALTRALDAAGEETIRETLKSLYKIGPARVVRTRLLQPLPAPSTRPSNSCPHLTLRFDSTF